jgi:hypothetical protein
MELREGWKMYTTICSESDLDGLEVLDKNGP